VCYASLLTKDEEEAEIKMQLLNPNWAAEGAEHSNIEGNS
jgi:hypothetical protein